MQLPYVSPEIRERFDAWLEGSIERYAPPLTFTELRKGVQAIVRLSETSGASRRQRLAEGQGKRAALATYFAALNFITAHHAVEMLDESLFKAPRIVDLGCLAGGTGAGLALGASKVRSIVGVDRSGWAKQEAERTWQSFGLSGKFQRVDFPLRWPALRAGDLLVLGWQLRGLTARERVPFIERLQGALRRGCALLVMESLASADDGWKELVKRLEPMGAGEETIRVAIQRPDWIRRMDTASRLNHQVVGARVLFRAPR